MTAAPRREDAAAPRVHPGTVQAASSLLAALAAPMRLSIVASLLQHETRCVHQLVDELGAAQPLVSQHLRVLREAGLVVGERRHREVHYALVDQHVGHIVRDALDHVSHSAEGAGPASVEEVDAGCRVDEGTR
ncbi:ArsR/SmtB family transcription factor [Modestobacter versicolor]|uniref:DNA-binding transcriptional ArsR family regulator n=1 Tax=Modestobacter versicolor TaxID=429133 RepID=A0A323V9F0_9ACTN|nr:metalloregulator ArsR/SmtB family transcription factor [Modestobacter versicolor]MBB3674981.1 DNA-binding transcriptional ArsR family regulator [Modestobacter versicolor]PZA20623.1 transcriptional regulator [Modestobacter versicolor]